MKPLYQVHLVPTDKAKLHLSTSTNTLYCFGNTDKITNLEYIAQFLYITSNEEIKEGDWYIHTNIEHNLPKERYYTLNQCHKTHRIKDGEWFVDGMFSKDCFKIVATNNRELIGNVLSEFGKEESKKLYKAGKSQPWNTPDTWLQKSNIAKIQPSFIEEYVKMYNLGSPITEVELETETVEDTSKDYIKGLGQPAIDVLLLTKEGEVIVKPKEQRLYTREDMKAAFRQGVDFEQAKENSFRDVDGFKKWFDKTYPNP